MDDPVREIPGIIATLTQGHSEDQARILGDYFLPDAYFVHPLCRVPSFGDFALPFPVPFVTGSSSRRTVNSRRLILMIYEWYRILSPQIKFTIDSIAFDQRASLLYLTIRQTFTLWFVPLSLWQANVKLVTVLDLAALPAGSNTTTPNHDDDTGNGGMNNDANHDASAQPRGARFFIRGQEDHYQVEEWLKFIAPWGASLLWIAWQLLATWLCVVGVLLWPFGLVRTVKRRQKQRLRRRRQEQQEKEEEEGEVNKKHD